MQLLVGHRQVCPSRNKKYIQNHAHIEEIIWNYEDYKDHDGIEAYLKSIVINPSEYDPDSEEEKQSYFVKISNIFCISLIFKYILHVLKPFLICYNLVKYY